MKKRLKEKLRRRSSSSQSQITSGDSSSSEDEYEQAVYGVQDAQVYKITIYHAIKTMKTRCRLTRTALRDEQGRNFENFKYSDIGTTVD